MIQGCGVGLPWDGGGLRGCVGRWRVDAGRAGTRCGPRGRDTLRPHALLACCLCTRPQELAGITANHRIRLSRVKLPDLKNQVEARGTKSSVRLPPAGSWVFGLSGSLTLFR